MLHHGLEPVVLSSVTYVRMSSYISSHFDPIDVLATMQSPSSVGHLLYYIVLCAMRSSGLYRATYVQQMAVMHEGPTPCCVGVPEYNCDVNTLKTMKNFHVLPNGRAQLDSEGGLGGDIVG